MFSLIHFIPIQCS